MSDKENSEMEIEEAKETDTRTESTSMEETEGQDTDLRTSESDARTAWRHERDPRSSGEKRENEPELGQWSWYPVRKGVADCHYYLNGGCFFGRSCRFNHPPRNQMGDNTVVQPSAYQVRLAATNCEQYLQTGQCSYGSKCWFNHPLVRHEMVQPSPYPVHPSARDCEQYVETGLCSYGRKCRFNHPPAQVLPDRLSRPICKFFQRGDCKHGSSFQYTNSMRGDGVEPMRQATTWVRRSDERRHETESSSREEKRKRTIPDPPERDPIKSDDVVAGQKSWLQRRQAQENVQRGNTDCKQRRESEEERTLRERQAHDLEEQKQREKIKATVQSDEGGIQTEQRLEIPENLQEQADMERENREAEKKAQEERGRSLTDNVDQLRRFVQDIVIERKEGDGL